MQSEEPFMLYNGCLIVPAISIDNHAYSDIHCVRSMKENSTGKHIGNIILAKNNPVFGLTHLCCMFIDRAVFRILMP